jgi:hypothetical protein
MPFIQGGFKVTSLQYIAYHNIWNAQFMIGTKPIIK